MTWEDIAAGKRAALQSSIPEEWLIPANLRPAAESPAIAFLDSTFFTPRDLELTSLSATATLKKLHSRAWTSEEVTRAYCKRAAAAQQLVYHSVSICLCITC